MIITQDMNDKLINDIVYKDKNIIEYLDGFDIINSYFDISVHDYQVYTTFEYDKEYTDYIIEYINNTRVVYNDNDLFELLYLLVELNYQCINSIDKDCEYFKNFVDSIFYNLRFINYTDKDYFNEVYDSTYRHKLEYLIYNYLTKIHNEVEENILNTVTKDNLFEVLDNYNYGRG